MMEQLYAEPVTRIFGIINGIIVRNGKSGSTGIKNMKTKKNIPVIDIDAIGGDFRYSLDIDYATERHCEEYGCDNICRCQTIENAMITSVDIPSIVDVICYKKCDEFTRYCVNRVLTGLKLYDSKNWHIDIQRSYYGEEIESVKLENPKLDEIKAKLRQIKDATTYKEKLFVALKAEYGYILDVLQEYKNFKITNVSPSDIRIGADLHYRKVNQEKSECYKNWNGIVGLCVGNDLRLIDGYHRYSVCKDKKMIKIIASV